MKLFAPPMLDDPVLALCPALAAQARHLPLVAGETLVHTGQPVRHVLYVVKGEVRLMRRSRSGTEVVLQRCSQGFFAEASLTVSRYHCDVVVAEAGSLMRFPVSAFRQALSDNCAFRDAWMARIARELRKVRAQCERLSLRSAADRVVHYIESEGAGGQVKLGQSRKAWALELGITHEALYRVLRRLQDEGVLVIDDDRLQLVDSCPGGEPSVPPRK